MEAAQAERIPELEWELIAPGLVEAPQARQTEASVLGGRLALVQWVRGPETRVVLAQQARELEELEQVAAAACSSTVGDVSDGIQTSSG